MNRPDSRRFPPVIPHRRRPFLAATVAPILATALLAAREDAMLEAQWGVARWRQGAANGSG